MQHTNYAADKRINNTYSKSFILPVLPVSLIPTFSCIKLVAGSILASSTIELLHKYTTQYITVLYIRIISGKSSR